ncbi:MAG: hypothetical protein CSA45_05940, partial [Gammaproteobacteria bacterium]
AVGAYLSFFVDGVTGPLIVVFQTAIFLLVFLFAPKHGLIANQFKQRHHRNNNPVKCKNKDAV